MDTEKTERKMGYERGMEGREGRGEKGTIYIRTESHMDGLEKRLRMKDQEHGERSIEGSALGHAGDCPVWSSSERGGLVTRMTSPV